MKWESQKLVNCWTTPKKFFLNKFRVLGKRWSWCGLDLIFFVFTLHWSSEFGSAKYFVDCFVWLYFCCFHFVLCFRIWNHNCQVIIHNFKTWHLFFNSSDRSGRYPKFYPPGSGNTQLTGFGSPRCTLHWFTATSASYDFPSELLQEGRLDSPAKEGMAANDEAR